MSLVSRSRLDRRGVNRGRWRLEGCNARVRDVGRTLRGGDVPEGRGAAVRRGGTNLKGAGDAYVRRRKVCVQTQRRGVQRLSQPRGPGRAGRRAGRHGSHSGRRRGRRMPVHREVTDRAGPVGCACRCRDRADSCCRDRGRRGQRNALTTQRVDDARLTRASMSGGVTGGQN